MAIAFVNQTTGSAAAALNATATVSSTTSNLLVALIARSGGLGTGAMTGVIDSAGNTWALATRGAVSGASHTRIECWYALNASAVTSITFQSAASQTYAWNVLEFSGVSARDTVSPDNSAGAASTTQTTPSITTTVSGDLVLAAIHYPQTTGTLTTGGFTAATNFDDGTAGSGRAAYQLGVAIGSYSASWTLGASSAAGLITVAFTAPAGGGAPPPAVPTLPGAMERLGPITSSAGTTYSAGQVMAMLFAPAVAPRWYFDLLGPDYSYKGDLTSYLDSSKVPIIDYDSTRAVKRILRGLNLRQPTGVDQQRDLIRVRFQITAPDGGYLEWRIGTFMMKIPQRTITEGITWWQLDAPDLSQKLAKATFGAQGLRQDITSSTGLAGLAQSGAGYPETVTRFVSGYGGWTPLMSDIPEPADKIPADLPFDVGSSYLKAINDLMTAIAYTSIYVPNDTVMARPFSNYAKAQPVLTLDATSGSTRIFGPFQETIDETGAFNKALCLSEDPRRATIRQSYENSSPDSPISTARADPFLTVIRDSKIASDLAAYYTARAAVQEAARIYSTLPIEMVPFPFFEDLDVIQFTYSSVDEGTVNQPYLVLKYQHPCGPEKTTLELQRVVTV